MSNTIPERRRQQLSRILLRQLHEQQPAGEQPHAGSQGPRSARGRQRLSLLGSESDDRRTARQGSRMVLRRLPLFRDPELRRWRIQEQEPVRQPVLRHRRGLHVRRCAGSRQSRSESAGDRRRYVQQGRNAEPDGAVVAAQQGDVLRSRQPAARRLQRVQRDDIAGRRRPTSRIVRSTCSRARGPIRTRTSCCSKAASRSTTSAGSSDRSRRTSTATVPTRSSRRARARTLSGTDRA